MNKNITSKINIKDTVYFVSTDSENNSITIECGTVVSLKINPKEEDIIYTIIAFKDNLEFELYGFEIFTDINFAIDEYKKELIW